MSTGQTSDFDPKAQQPENKKEKRVNGNDNSSAPTMNYGEKKLKDTKQDKDLNKYTDLHTQDGEHNDKKETTGNNLGKKPGEKLYTHYVDCPPGKDEKEYLQAIADSYSSQTLMGALKVKCKDKTDKGSSGGGTTPPATPGGGTPLPLINVAGQGQLQGAGKMVTNPVDLQNKVVDFHGQQYFSPQGGLPTPPSGYSWQGTDFATLVNNTTRNALSVAQTLQVFNGQSQSSARGPTTPSGGGGGTNPAPLPNTSFGFNQTISTPISDAVYGTSRGVADTQAFYDSIIKGESMRGNPYDAAQGFTNLRANSPFPKPISQMTLAEVRYWGSQNAKNFGAASTAMGAFQIINGTRDLAQRALGLTDSTIYSPEVQQRMASWIARNQGLGAWEGLKANPGLMATARAELAKGGQVGSYQIVTGNSSFPYGIGPAGSSQTPIGGGGAAGGTGGTSSSNAGGSPAGGGMGSGSSFDIQYKRNSAQQEGQGGYIAQAAAASIAARTGNLGSLGNLTSQQGLGGLASNALGAFGGPTASGSVSPNYNVPNWGGSSGGSGVSSAGDAGVNPASAIGTIPNNSATMFPTSMTDFSSVGNSLGSVPNAYTNLPTTAPLAATNGINSNLGAAANNLVPQTPTGQYGQFGQSITGAGGGGGSTKKKEGEAEVKEQKTTRPTQTTKRMNRDARKKPSDDKELDKDLDKKVPLPPKRPDELSKPYTHAITRRKNEGDEGPENPSVTQAPGVDPHAFTSDMSGMARNLTGAIPGLESLMSRIPNQLLGSFMGNLPAGLQSLLPQGLISGLNLGPVSLNNMLQMVGGGALGGMAGQMIRSMSGGIPVASMLTQSLQSVPISQVFGSLGQSVGANAASIANTLGSITSVASMGMGGIPINPAQLNQAISYAVASSGASIPVNIAGQVANNPIGSLVNIAMGGMIANGSVPILPTNLSGTNAALLAGLNQTIPQEDAQMILTIGQITNLLPPNVRNMIPQVSPSAFGGPTNAVQNNRNNSARQTDPNQIHGGGGGGGNQLGFIDADKTNIGDTRNVPYGMKLSEHFTLYQLTRGVAVSTGCHPLLPLHGMSVDEVVQNLMLLARNILEPIRAEIGPFTINSGFRGDDPTTKRNKNWERSLHGYGRAADLSWGSAGRIAQAHAFAAARLRATENLHEGTWLHIAVAGGTGGKGGNAQSRTPEGNIQQGVNRYKGYPSQVNQ